MLTPSDIEREMHLHRTLAERCEMLLNQVKHSEEQSAKLQELGKALDERSTQNDLLMTQITSLSQQIAELKLPSKE